MTAQAEGVGVAVQEMGVETVVPGHGPVGTAADLREQLLQPGALDLIKPGKKPAAGN